MRFVLIGVALGWLLLSGLAQAQNGQRRVALVIGNGAYTHEIPKLRNPGNDARLLARTLAALGFELIGGGALLDQNGAQMRDAMHMFGQKLGGDTVAVFYYSGHGVEYHGENYLVPVDAMIRSAADVDYALVSANFLLRQIAASGGGMSMVILDACRSNPFGRGLKDIGTGGLATMHAPRGTLIAYATAPGTVAVDGSGSNSPFASALASAMRQPGLALFDMFNTVALQVDEQTNHEQQPWISASPIKGAFYFTPPSGAAPAPAPPMAMASPDRPAPTPVPVPPVPPVSMLAPAPREPPTATAEGAVTAEEAFAKGSAAERARDYEMAMRWYRQAADKGSADAMNNIGNLYGEGDGVRKDEAEAMRWYRQAADKGQVAALLNMASYYEWGRGVRTDQAEATRWYRQAADLGDGDAMEFVGTRYALGVGVTRDCDAAHHWFEKAVAAGNEDAKLYLNPKAALGKKLAFIYLEPSKACSWD
jgi:hypothetical protein